MKNWLKYILFTLLGIVIGGALVYLVSPKLMKDNNVEKEESVEKKEEKITNEATFYDSVEIKNSEVKELYNYLQPSIKSNSVCLGFFYQNSFKNHTLEDKISLVIINYGLNYKKEVDDEFIKKAKSETNIEGEYYIEGKVIKEGLKYLFNIEIDSFDSSANYWYKYNKNADSFISISGGGGYMAEIVQQVIEYNEKENEINLTVVKAEINDDKVYRYVNKENTFVEDSSYDNFKFTKDNYNNYEQLKYVFKKNENGKYYISDIINLNYPEDYEECK